MKKKIEEYYQRLILQDIEKPQYPTFRKYFPWIVLSFFLLQIFYYFHLFHGRTQRVIAYIRFFHQQTYLMVAPKAVMFAYDELLLFLLYLFFILMFVVLSFIAFDYSQRSKIIRRLKDKHMLE